MSGDRASIIFSVVLSIILPLFLIYLSYLSKLWGFRWVLLALVVVGAVGIACLLLIRSLLRWIESRAPCPHGARVGSRRGDCPECEIAAIRAQERQKAETAQRDSRDIIRRKAMALRAAEIKRLSALWSTRNSSPPFTPLRCPVCGATVISLRPSYSSVLLIDVMGEFSRCASCQADIKRTLARLRSAN